MRDIKAEIQALEKKLVVTFEQYKKTHPKTQKSSNVVVKGPRYKQELKELMKDPIIIEMAKDIKKNPQARKDFSEPNFNAMQMANKIYKQKGGKKAKSIGGPANAIKELNGW